MWLNEIGAWRAIGMVATACLCALGVLGCSGASGSRSENSPEARAAIRRYHAYLERNADALVTKIDELIPSVRTGYVTHAESLYVIARVPYGHIEAIAESFPQLDSRINALPGEVPPAKLTGFHRLEKAFWTEGSTGTKGATPAAAQLVADAKTLRRKIQTVTLRPDEVIADARRLLAEISSSTVDGHEESYADADLADVAAGIEGVEAAFRAAKPLLSEEGNDITAIESQFHQLYAVLEGYGQLARKVGRPKATGAIFVEYSSLSPAKVRDLKQKIDKLAKLMS